MKRSLNIFVDSQQRLGVFVDELETILGFKFRQIVTEHETYYEFCDTTTYVSVGSHDFENDRQLNFEDYAYDIAVDIVNVEDAAERQKLKQELGHLLFEKLKGTQKYALMMVEDLQVKWAEFKPEQAYAQ